MKLVFLCSTALAGVVILASCGGGSSNSLTGGGGGTGGAGVITPTVRAIALTPASETQHWGKTVQVQAIPTDSFGAVVAGQTIAYVSSDPNVATVNNIGLVTLVNPGAASITAVISNVTSNASAITVKGFIAASLTVFKEDNCALDDTKTEIICWGDGYPINGNLPLQLQYPSPLKLNLGQLASGTLIKQVAPGFKHSCALTEAGAAYCWAGAAAPYPNEVAAMGTNSQMPITQPALVQRGEIPTGVKLLKLSQGSSSTCGVADDGNVYCWGAVDGVPRTVSGFPIGTNFYNAPVKLISTVKFTDFAMGTNRSCALSEAGQLYCGRTGSTGTGNGGNAGTLTLVVNPASEVPANVKLVKLKSEEGDGDFMTALGDDGWVYSFGGGFGRRFGNGSNVFVSDTTRLTRVGQGNIPVGVKIKDFSPGGIASSNCVLGDNGKAYCWGRGYYGSLGDGNLVDHDALSPQLVLQGQVPANVTLVSIGCGTFHCSAIGSDRKTYAWGFNEGAAIGGTVSVAVPTLINKVGN